MRRARCSSRGPPARTSWTSSPYSWTQPASPGCPSTAGDPAIDARSVLAVGGVEILRVAGFLRVGHGTESDAIRRLDQRNRVTRRWIELLRIPAGDEWRRLRIHD